ncbi:hypothetical protein BRADI_3g31500v3 [Brachypodium distachyon]|uniref:26S proteasome regulatory subunit Rpn7 N-terminal domain-containing protein n=1 Tax=Brachypodium distachyon TaxID=15368 RepID=A0A0Q3JH12_BRADI|nr:hypothetical protein BRADI_3g31500v3 [Brachypodium distachyon]
MGRARESPTRESPTRECEFTDRPLILSFASLSSPLRLPLPCCPPAVPLGFNLMDVEDELPTAPPSANGGGEASLVAVSGDQFDLEAYAAQYSGRTRVARLLFIAGKCGSEPMWLDALRLAYDESLKGEDTTLHHDVSARIAGRLGPRYGVDLAWSDAVERRALMRKDKLDSELNGYRTNLIKESIRMGYNDFGDFHYARGQLSEALKSYIRTRDYCTNPKHVVQMCMNVILVSIELGQFMHVSNYVSKAEQTPEDIDPVTVAKLRAAAGIAYLGTNKYKLAARKFIETGSELRNNYSEVIAPQDVAIYGALCALASFDRSELKSKVIDNYNFRNFLELVPEVRELVHDFYARIRSLGSWWPGIDVICTFYGAGINSQSAVCTRA